MSYTLKVAIDKEWVEKMKKMKFRLCVAKKVNDTYTLVWSSKDDYDVINNFGWEDNYKICATHKFEDGVSLLQDTFSNIQPIAFGQTVVRQESGILKEAFGPSGEGASFKFVNEGGDTSAVVQQLVGNEYQTIWVDSDGMPNGVMKLTPRPRVMVFFDKEMKTSTMFAETTGPVKEIDFTGTKAKTVTFTSAKKNPKLGVWVDGTVTPGEAQFVEAVQVAYSIGNGFSPLDGGYLALETGETSGDGTVAAGSGDA